MALIARERVTKNEALKRERDRASFDSDELSSVLYGREQLKRKRYIGTVSVSFLIGISKIEFFVL